MDKKNGKKIKETKKEAQRRRKKNSRYVSFISFGDKSLHADRGTAFYTHSNTFFVFVFFSFRETTLSPCPPAKSEQNVSFFDIVVKLSDRPLR